jgi:arginine repressor
MNIKDKRKQFILDTLKPLKEYTLDDIHRMFWLHGIVLTDASVRGYLKELSQEKLVKATPRKQKNIYMGMVTKIIYTKVG